MEIVVRQIDPSNRRKHSDRTYQYHEFDTDRVLEQFEGHEKPGESEILFVTGNQFKVNELRQMIDVKRVTVRTLDIDAPEIQDADVLSIVQDKCLRAYEHIEENNINNKSATDKIDGDNGSGEKKNCFVLVEDTCLNFKALNDMPGPYVKWFVEAVGNKGLHRMLAGFEDKSAEAVCIYALMEVGNKSRILFFKGVARGTIIEPSGCSWGWDPIFREERSGLTFGEMDMEMKSKFSHRASALMSLRKYLSIFLGKRD